MMKDYYKIKDIKEGEIVFTTIFLHYSKLNYKINDEITFLDRNYKVVQIVDSENRYAFVNKNDYYKQKGKVEEYYKIVLIFDNLVQRRETYLHHGEELVRFRDYMYIENNIYYYIDVINTIFTIVCFMVIYIFQMIFEIIKQREDIASFQLLGLTHKEIYQIYFFKSLYISFIGLIIGSGYYFLDIYYQYQSLTQIDQLFAPLSIFIHIISVILLMNIVNCLILVPLKHILSQDAFENKNIRE